MITLGRPPTPILNNPTSFWFVFVEEIRKMCAFGEQAVLPKSNGNVLGNSSEKQEKKDERGLFRKDFDASRTLQPCKANFKSEILLIHPGKRLSEAFSVGISIQETIRRLFSCDKRTKRLQQAAHKNSEENKEVQLLPGKEWLLQKRSAWTLQCFFYQNWTTFPQEEKSKEQQ